LKDDFKDWPLLRLHQTPTTRGEDESVPCCDGQSANEEVLVSTEMRR
jgi:hypothetical protein